VSLRSGLASGGCSDADENRAWALHVAIVAHCGPDLGQWR
jgi:hypothetical protein